jgi:hypothetical protein
MITEDFCSQELYNLLIEKGFEVSSYDAPFTYRLVTHQSAMKWLREVHKLHIEIDVYKDIKYAWSLSHADSGEYVINPLKLKDKSYSTYEEAVEDAIKYVLENFI